MQKLRAPLCAIAVVIAIAVAFLVAARTSSRALQRSLEELYARTAFADLFVEADLDEDAVATLRGSPGIARVTSSLQWPLRLELDTATVPGIVRSLESQGEALNRLWLVAGRLPDAGAADQAVVGRAFAAAHDLELGDELLLRIAGRRHEVAVVGVAISPEAVDPGAGLPLAEPGSLALLWMAREPLVVLLGLSDFSNRLAIDLAPGASPQTTQEVVSALLARSNPAGEISTGPAEIRARNEHLSHRAVLSELSMLRVTGWAVSLLFLAIALFLLHLVIARVIVAQRAEISVLESLGTSRLQLLAQYLRLARWPGVRGLMFGTAAGWWLAERLVESYESVFDLPVLEPHLGDLIGAAVLSAALLVLACSASVAITLANRWREAPAVRLRGAGPRTTQLIRWPVRVDRWLGLDIRWRLALRELVRHPARCLGSLLAVGLGVALVVLTGSLLASADELLGEVFARVERQHVEVQFEAPLAESALNQLRRVDGVLAVEPQLTLPATLTLRGRSHSVQVVGLVSRSSQFRLWDRRAGAAQVSRHGLVVSSSLAQRLGLSVGDLVHLDFSKTRGRRIAVPVQLVLDDWLGSAAYLEIGTLARLHGAMTDGAPPVSGARLLLDARHEAHVREVLGRSPRVVSVVARSERIESAGRALKEGSGAMLGVYVVAACLVVLAISYNLLRIALVERGRDLASLRRLGVGNAQVQGTLLRELALLLAAGLTLGWGLGRVLQLIAVEVMSTDDVRLPGSLSPSALTLAALAVVVAFSILVLLTRRKLTIAQV